MNITLIRDFGRCVEITTPSGTHTLTLTPRARAVLDKLERKATDHRWRWTEQRGGFTDYTFDEPDAVDEESCPYYDEDPRSATWYASRAQEGRIEAWLAARE